MQHAIRRPFAGKLFAALLAFASMQAFAQPKEITVAYFLEWPTPNQVAQLEKTFDKKMGVKVNWKAFPNGNDMSAAMASDSVQISYSQGLIPFIVATSKGLPITTVGVAVSYADADTCVVNNAAGIDRSSKASMARTLRGKSVATPIGNVTHYKLLKTLDHYGLSGNDMKIVPVSGGNDAAAAFLTRKVDIACAFGGPVDRMLESGTQLMTGAEQEKIGILTFDVISVTNKFLKDHPEMVEQFLQITEDANREYAANPGAKLNTLAKAAGMKPKATRSLLKKFVFPTKNEQLSRAWLGGSAQELTKGAADFFVKQGVMKSSLRSYDQVYDTSFLKRVK
ncbi:MAG: ABC transporter substrate-binding protein [Gammaproteobacteria bacterium]|nr:ABC transporter substrate-binding protein [Gammaproteobacteria bacterium]